MFAAPLVKPSSEKDKEKESKEAKDAKDAQKKKRAQGRTRKGANAEDTAPIVEKGSGVFIFINGARYGLYNLL